MQLAFLTAAEIVEKYRVVSRSTLYSAARDGLIPFYRIPSRKGNRGKLVFKEEDFLAWLETCRFEGGAADADGELTFLG